MMMTKVKYLKRFNKLGNGFLFPDSEVCLWQKIRNSVLSEPSSVVAHNAPFWCFEIWCRFISV